MSLEVWGDEGLHAPDGYVTEETYMEVETANKELLDACRLMYLSLYRLRGQESLWTPSHTEVARRAMATGLKALQDHTPGGFERRPTDDCHTS